MCSVFHCHVFQFCFVNDIDLYSRFCGKSERYFSLLVQGSFDWSTSSGFFCVFFAFTKNNYYTEDVNDNVHTKMIALFPCIW